MPTIASLQINPWKAYPQIKPAKRAEYLVTIGQTTTCAEWGPAGWLFSDPDSIAVQLLLDKFTIRAWTEMPEACSDTCDTPSPVEPISSENQTRGIFSPNTTVETKLKCPKCQKTGTFTIYGSASFDVDSAQSIFDHDDYHWEDSTLIECHQCSHSCTVKDFQIHEIEEEAP